MDCYNSEDKEFMKCASDVEIAKKRLDYLVGKRWFIGACCAVLAVMASTCYIGWRFLATEPAALEGARFGMLLFGAFAVMCFGFGASIDGQVKALILHVHKENSQQPHEEAPSASHRQKRRHARVKQVVIMCGLSLLLVNSTFATALDTYKATYEKEMEAIILAHGMKMTRVSQQYTKALDTLLTKVKKAGDLDKTTAVMDEVARFRNQKAMPSQPSALLDIENLQSYFTRQVAPYESDKAKRIIRLTTKYDQALARLQRNLVASDRLDEAKAVQKERKGVQGTAAYQAAKTFLSNAAATRRPQAQDNTTSPKAASHAKRPTARSIPGLVLYYSFDRIVRNRIEDGSQCKNHGKNHGGTPEAEGKVNGAILLDGKNDYISMGDRLDIGKNNTVSVWVKVPPAGQAGLDHGERVGVILGNNASGTPPYSNWEIWGDGRMGAWWNAGEKSFGAPPDLRDDGWHHLAWIKDNSTDTFTAYVDGELVTTLDGAGADLRFRAKHRVGADNRSGIMPFFHGMLDELMIFDRALSPEELETLRQAE